MKDVQYLAKRMAPPKKMVSNKPTMLTAATERWTVSFCIVLYPFELFDSLLLEDYYGLECLGDAA